MVGQRPSRTDLKKPAGISLSPVEIQGLTELAIREGHLSRSRVVQRLVNNEASLVLGKDWKEKLRPTADDPQHPEKAA